MSDIDSILKKIEQLSSEIESLKKENLELKNNQHNEEKRKALLSYRGIVDFKTQGKLLENILCVLNEEREEKLEAEDFEKDWLRKLKTEEIVELYREGKLPKVD